LRIEQKAIGVIIYFTKLLMSTGINYA